MKNDNLPGLSPLWLISLAMALGVFLSVAIPLIVSVNTINSTAWIGFCGSILGGAIALIAVVVTTRNVRRQLRVNLLSREEDRMEEELPGLRQAFEFLDYCRTQFLPDPNQILETLRGRGIEVDKQMSLDDFAQQFSMTDKRTLRMVFELIDRIISRCHAFSKARAQLETLQQEMINDISVFFEQRKQWRSTQTIDVARHFEILKGYLDALNAAASGLDDRIERTNRRLLSFREEIEEYFEPE